MDGTDLQLEIVLDKLKTSGQLYETDLSLLVPSNILPTEKTCFCLLVASISYAVGNIVPDLCQGRECPWSRVSEVSDSNKTTAMYILDTVMEGCTALGYESRSHLAATLLIAIGEAKNGALSGSLGSLLLRSLMSQLGEH